MMNIGRVILKISFSCLDLVRWSRDVIEMSRLVLFSFELWIMSSNWSIFKFCLALWEVLAMCRIRIKSSWNFCWLTGVLGKVIIKKTAPPGGRKILDVLRRPGGKKFWMFAKAGEQTLTCRKGERKILDASSRGEFCWCFTKAGRGFRLNGSNIVEILPFNCGFTPLWGIKIDFTVLVAFQVLFSSSIRV